jgi:RimJ/RimL family protein N-acetyltransferase
MTEPLLETRRLILRLPIQADFDGWAEFQGDEEAMRHLGGALPRSTAWRAFAAAAGMWPLLGFGPFSVIEKATGLWVGRVGPWAPDGWPAKEVGWMLRRSAWGQGYAAEAARSAIDWAFAALAWSEVAHFIHPSNLSSQRLAARLGSHRLGPARLPPPLQGAPAERWGQSRETWMAARAGGSVL